MFCTWSYRFPRILIMVSFSKGWYVCFVEIEMVEDTLRLSMEEAMILRVMSETLDELIGGMA